MKRLILAILSLFYLASATGTSLHLHYCMGQLENWSLVRNEAKKCGECDMEKMASESNDCCKDESKHIQLTVDQESKTLVAYHSKQIEHESIITFTGYPDYLLKQEVSTAARIDNLSGHSCIATYIRNRNLRL